MLLLRNAGVSFTVVVITPTYIGNSPIWYNSLIRMANQPVFYRNWSRAGVIQFKDILDHTSDFLKYEDFKSRYKVKTTFFTYYGVVSAMNKLKKSFQDPVMTNSKTQTTCGQKLLSSSNFCKEAYKLIVKGITSTPAKSQRKWITDCGNYENSIK